MTITMAQWREAWLAHRCKSCASGDHSQHVDTYFGDALTQDGKQTQGHLHCRCPQCCDVCGGRRTMH